MRLLSPFRSQQHHCFGDHKVLDASVLGPSLMLIAVRAVTIMSTDTEEQVEDADMDDTVDSTVSGSIDVASKAHEDVMKIPTAASMNIGLEENNGINADDDSATKLAKDEQINATDISTDPATEVEDSNIDIWDGNFGKDPEKLSPDILVTRLQGDNLALQNKVTFLENEITDIAQSVSYLALKNKVAVLENKVAILKGNKTRLSETSNEKIAELKAFITTQHNALSNTNNTINNANRTIAGKQKQLDSVYAALLRQENQILGQQHHIITQQNQITAQAAHINTLQTKHKKQLHNIRKYLNKMYRSVIHRSQKHATEVSSITRRCASELELVLNNRVEDPEATEGEEDEEEDVDVNGEDGNEEKEIEVIDLLDENDGGEVAAIEEPGHIHQSTIFEHLDTVQQPPIVEQDDIAVQAVASEESSNKRVKLTEQT
jgi:hypothetical protein